MVGPPARVPDSASLLSRDGVIVSPGFPLVASTPSPGSASPSIIVGRGRLPSNHDHPFQRAPRAIALVPISTYTGTAPAPSSGCVSLSRVGGTDRLEVGRTDRPRGPGLALVIEADERSARGRQN